jgi:hypothetical protein
MVLENIECGWVETLKSLTPRSCPPWVSDDKYCQGKKTLANGLINAQKLNEKKGGGGARASGEA